MDKMDAEQLHERLGWFTGSEMVYVQALQRLELHGSVQFLAENKAGLFYWLLDVVSSYQYVLLNGQRL